MRRGLAGVAAKPPSDNQRPQPSSASRLTAGAAGFLNFNQSGERPNL
jgi:hypothetical protein